MATAASTLTADDELYDALYDVRREAEEVGNSQPEPIITGGLEQRGVSALPVLLK